MAITRRRQTSDILLREVFEAPYGGLDLASALSSIPTNKARIIQDFLIHRPGMLIRRGPIKKAAEITATYPATKIVALFSTISPTNIERIGTIAADGNIYVLSDAGDSWINIGSTSSSGWGANPPTSPYPLVHVSPAIGGGVWVGIADKYEKGSSRVLFRWLGSNKPEYSTGTISVTRGSTTVTGSGTSFSANVTSGMFLFANTDDPYTQTYVGIVKTVNSDTSLTLYTPSPYNITSKAYTLKPIKGFSRKVVTGSITCSTTSTTVTGSLTKFKQEKLDVGSWNLYRRSDWAWIGKVATVNNDISITLAANAAVGMNEEKYIALRGDDDFSINAVTNNKVGFITGIYAGIQWYANKYPDVKETNSSMIFFSDPEDPEMVNLAEPEGDFIIITSSHNLASPIVALVPTYNALLIFKANEVFSIVGSTPTQFSVRKLGDDGALCGMAATSYGGGAIWPGRDGILFYDGLTVANISAESLGNYYQRMMNSFDATKYRIWSMVIRDHILFHIEGIIDPVPITKGTTAVSNSHKNILMHIPRKAIVFLTNTNIRGSIRFNPSSNRESYYAVNDDTRGYVCNGAHLFDTIGPDEISVDGQSPGPDLFLETRKMNLQDPTLLKYIAYLIIHAFVSGADHLKIDVAEGLTNVGTTLSSVLSTKTYTWDTLKNDYSTWDILGSAYDSWDALMFAQFVPMKVYIRRRDQNLSFRLYQSGPNIADASLGPYEVAYRIMRGGRTSAAG
jgi:hypothetical protein